MTSQLYPFLCFRTIKCCCFYLLGSFHGYSFILRKNNKLVCTQQDWKIWLRSTQEHQWIQPLESSIATSCQTQSSPSNTKKRAYCHSFKHKMCRPNPSTSNTVSLNENEAVFNQLWSLKLWDGTPTKFPGFYFWFNNFVQSSRIDLSSPVAGLA